MIALLTNLKTWALILLFSQITWGQNKTVVSIVDDAFYINGKITYSDRYWQGNKIEGLLLNSRMVQGIFDDLNPETKDNFIYPDTKKWSAKRNNKEFVSQMKNWRDHGLLAFTLNLQGGSPLGYGNKGWINSTFTPTGDIRKPYLKRLNKILKEADKLGMVVILGYFYFGQDEWLKDEAAVINAVDNMSHYLLRKKYKNVIVEVNNECNIKYDHDILKPERVHELIKRIKDIEIDGHRLLVSTSYGGGTLPKTNVVSHSDFILLHGNGIKDPDKITQLVNNTRKVEGYHNQPIVFNEDDHFDFDKKNNNFVNAVKSYASWGYFDYRMKGEGFDDGFQSVPVNWGISSPRKKDFFMKLKEITGY
ncbi:hypothetical protein [Membranihabitans marinus]|uniref:hypothetical protein n=1 Tax=Membranihabitans marinus TaxID=1227546 RepID=UPI001F42E338|nr:hypothetical protein [Membranihabitans marinus]